MPAARRWAALFARMGGDPRVKQLLDGYVMARSGDSAGVRRLLQGMEGEGRLAQRALLLATIGDKDAMYAMFERAIDARDTDAIWFLNTVPALRPWRHEPRYQALLARMGLPEELRR